MARIPPPGKTLCEAITSAGDRDGIAGDRKEMERALGAAEAGRPERSPAARARPASAPAERES